MRGHIDHSLDFFGYVDNFAKCRLNKSLSIFSSSIYEGEITIAIPTFKRSCLLKEALDSALALDGDYSYEVIVVDNNPARGDETEIMMSDYQRDGRVSYYKNAENLGQAGNWNRCFSLSRSEWVVLLHDDDCLEPDFLIKTVPYLSRLHPAILNTRKYSTQGNRPSRLINNIKRVAKLDIIYGNAVEVPSGIIFNRKVVIEQGGFNNDFYPSHDYCFHTLLLSKYPVYILNENLTFYRKDVSDSLSLQVQEDWLIFGYYLIWQVLERYRFPRWIILPFLQVRTYKGQEIIQSAWHSSVAIPKNKLWGDKDYSSFRKSLSYVIVSFFYYIERIKARISCLLSLIKS